MQLTVFLLFLMFAFVIGANEVHLSETTNEAGNTCGPDGATFNYEIRLFLPTGEESVEIQSCGEVTAEKCNKNQHQLILVLDGPRPACIANGTCVMAVCNGNAANYWQPYEEEIVKEAANLSAYFSVTKIGNLSLCNGMYVTPYAELASDCDFEYVNRSCHSVRNTAWQGNPIPNGGARASGFGGTTNTLPLPLKRSGENKFFVNRLRLGIKTGITYVGLPISEVAGDGARVFELTKAEIEAFLRRSTYFAKYGYTCEVTV